MVGLKGDTDKPIEASGQDIFGIGIYVEGLCSFISECDTPMTISIQGDWGSGKTSFMNMVRERMSSSKILTIWFNTWQFSQYGMDEALSICMLSNLLKELSVDEESKKGIIGKLAGATVGLMKFGGMVLAEKTIGSMLTGKIMDDAANAETLENASETLKNLKNEYQKAIDQKLSTEGKDRIVVFVDDLDRLQPEKAVELLEAMKIFLDCENCVYLLAVDYEIIQQGLTQKFGSSVDPKKGRNFFDKIVQLPFKMPVEQYDIKKYVADMLGKMSIPYGKHLSLYTNLIKHSIGYNPRSMKRLFNTFMLLNIIISGRQFYKDSKTPEILNRMLFAILCMQMEFDCLYKIIATSQNALDSDLLTSLSNSDELKTNQDYSEFAKSPDDDIKKMCAFMEIFIEGIKAVPSDELQPSDIDDLKSLLFFASMTSVSSGIDTREETDKEWDIRYKNKAIVKALNDYIKKTFNYDFYVYQTRKSWPNWKISDTSAHCNLKDSFKAEYFIKRDFSARNLLLSLAIYPNAKLSQTPVTVYSFDHIDITGAKAYEMQNVANHLIDKADSDIVKAFTPHINEFMKIIKQHFPL